MFAKIIREMGFNNIYGPTPEICHKVGIEPFQIIRPSCGFVCDPADPAWPMITRKSLKKQFTQAKAADPDYAKYVKAVFVSDEIGAIAGISKINQSTDCLKRFRQYLARILKEKKLTPAFFGVESLEQLEGLERLPHNPGVFERRLYYYSARFREELTADFYRPILKVCENLYPEALVFSNFSPASLRQGSQTMNHASWFSQPRLGSVNTAWGEDWSYDSGSFTGYEIISYYAALVECAARRPGCRSGFFNIPNCGRAATNITSILSRNIKNLLIFRFGPLYNGTGISDNWSDNKKAYPEIIKAIYIASFIGKPLADGKIEKRKVALLYNRDNEIMNGGNRGEQSDRALTFAALANCHYNADIILNEDLTANKLKQYSALFINGACLPRAAVPVIKQWVEHGGLLVAAANTATRDEFNSPLPEMEKIFGARQFNFDKSSGYFTPITLYRHRPITTITIKETDFSPSLTAAVVGQKNSLQPTTAKPIAEFADGTCAATVNKLGLGRVILWGIQPGIIYKGRRENPFFLNEMSRYDDKRLAIFEKPLRKCLGEASLSCNAKQLELTRFNTKPETGILINNFKRHDWTPKIPPMQIRLKLPNAGRVKSIRSALHGKLLWQHQGDWLTITCPVPKTIDSILIK